MYVYQRVMSPEKKPGWGVTSVEGHRYYTVYTGVPKISRFPRYILPCEMHTHTYIYIHMMMMMMMMMMNYTWAKLSNPIY